MFHLTTHNYTAPDDVKQFIEERIRKIAERIRIIGADAYITKNTRHNKGDVFEVEINLHVPKKIFVAKAKQCPDVRSAIHSLEEKLAHQIARYKGTHANNRA